MVRLVLGRGVAVSLSLDERVCLAALLAPLCDVGELGAWRDLEHRSEHSFSPPGWNQARQPTGVPGVPRSLSQHLPKSQRSSQSKENQSSAHAKDQDGVHRLLPIFHKL